MFSSSPYFNLRFLSCSFIVLTYVPPFRWLGDGDINEDIYVKYLILML